MDCSIMAILINFNILKYKRDKKIKLGVNNNEEL